MHRGPCGRHKLKSSEEVLKSTIQKSHSFALRPFPFSLLLCKVLHLPSLDGRAGEADRDGSGWLALASSDREHGECPSCPRVAPAGQGMGLGGSATCMRGARWRSSGGGDAMAVAVAEKGEQKGRRDLGKEVPRSAWSGRAQGGPHAPAGGLGWPRGSPWWPK